MKRLVGIFALFLAVMLLGCTGGGGGDGVGPGGTTADDLSLVPQGANSILMVKVADVVNDAMVKAKVDELISQMPSSARKIGLTDGSSRTYSDLDGLCTILNEEYGINPKSITRVIMFGDSLDFYSGASDNAYGGFIVRGSYDKDKLMKLIEKDNELKETKYKDVTLYYPDTEYGSPPYLAFPDDSTMIMATEKAVKDVIDARAGGKSLKDVTKMMKVVGEINSDAWVVYGAKVPSDVKESFGNAESTNTPFGDIDVSVFSKVDYFALSLTKSGLDVDAKSALLASSSSAASDISNELKSAKTSIVNALEEAINGGDIPSDQEDMANSLKKALDEMTIDTKDDVVVVGMSMPLEDIIQFSMFFFAGSTTASQAPTGNAREYAQTWTETGLSTIGVNGFTPYDDGSAFIDLINDRPTKITVTDINIGGSGSTNEAEMQPGTSAGFRVSGTGITGDAGEEYSGSLEITFTDTDSGLDHTETGTITGKIYAT